MVRLPENRGDEPRDSDAPSLSALSQEVKELVRLISATDISELHLESGQVRITIKRGGTQPTGSYVPAAYTPAVALPEAQPGGVLSIIGNRPTHGEDVVLAEGEHLVESPMVGTFYAAPGPTEDPFVSEGDLVEPGQTVGIIEAMKMMNPIDCEFTGRVSRILVQNAQPVEYGQPLMVIST